MDLCGRHYPVLTFSIHGSNKPTRVTQKSSTESEGGEDGIFHLAICKACSRIYLRQIRNNEEIETSNAHPHPHVPHSHHTLTHRASSNLSSLHNIFFLLFSPLPPPHHPKNRRQDSRNGGLPPNPRSKQRASGRKCKLLGTKKDGGYIEHYLTYFQKEKNKHKDFRSRLLIITNYLYREKKSIA